MTLKKPLNNASFFRLLARKGLEHVHVSEHLDPEVKEVLQHIKDSTEEKLRDEDGPEDPDSIETEGKEL